MTSRVPASSRSSNTLLESPNNNTTLATVLGCSLDKTHMLSPPFCFFRLFYQKCQIFSPWPEKWAAWRSGVWLVTMFFGGWDKPVCVRSYEPWWLICCAVLVYGFIYLFIYFLVAIPVSVCVSGCYIVFTSCTVYNKCSLLRNISRNYLIKPLWWL